MHHFKKETMHQSGEVRIPELPSRGMYPRDLYNLELKCLRAEGVTKLWETGIK